jgi:hypothetical protein
MVEIRQGLDADGRLTGLRARMEVNGEMLTSQDVEDSIRALDRMITILEQENSQLRQTRLMWIIVALAGFGLALWHGMGSYWHGQMP